MPQFYHSGIEVTVEAHGGQDISARHRPQRLGLGSEGWDLEVRLKARELRFECADYKRGSST